MTGRYQGYGQQRGHDVHARFLCIVHLKGAHRGEGCSQQGARARQIPTRQEVCSSHHEHTEKHREATRGCLRRAEYPDPIVQDNIVQRRVDVIGCILEDGGHIALHKRHRGALIVPEALAIQTVEPQCEGKGQNRQKGDQLQPARRSHRWSRLRRMSAAPPARISAAPTGIARAGQSASR